MSGSGGTYVINCGDDIMYFSKDKVPVAWTVGLESILSGNISHTTNYLDEQGVPIKYIHKH